jgi:hypothetical protein
MTPALTPAVIFLPIGALLGPSLLGWLSPRVLERLDLAVAIGLCVLGVLVGVSVGREARGAVRMLLAASVESAVTIAAVAVAAAYFVRATGAPIDTPLIALACILGLCASASSATSADPDVEPAAAVATRIADLDDVLPIVGAVAVRAVLAGGARDDVLMALAAPAIGVAIGAIGWLIFERAESLPERAVFVLGALSLGGGAASYVGTSPLAVGLVAGLIWTVMPGRADRLVHEDLQRVQHPVVVLLLVTAGALTQPSRLALWLLIPYVLFRLAGKVVGAWLSSRFVDAHAGDLAAYLMSPGVLGVAFALSFRSALAPATAEVLLSVAAIGTAAFELFALAVVPHWQGSRSR